jgi:hypothetical protein
MEKWIKYFFVEIIYLATYAIQSTSVAPEPQKV